MLCDGITMILTFDTVVGLSILCPKYLSSRCPHTSLISFVDDLKSNSKLEKHE